VAEAAGSGSRLNRVRVVIGGDEYTLRTDEPAKHVEKLAARVDRDLSDLAERFPGVPRERLAVLLALRLSGQLERARELARTARKAPRTESAAPEAAPAEPTAQTETPATGKGSPASGSSLFDSPQGDPTL
jgi:cell division protein ZapA (FtsZ GTPase activity inhibitor)